MGRPDATAELPPAVPAGDIAVAAPPELPGPASATALVRLLPVVMSVTTMGVMAAYLPVGIRPQPQSHVYGLPDDDAGFDGGHGGDRTSRRRGGGIDADRTEYLGYLGRLRHTVAETEVTQRLSLGTDHPEPEALWMLIGGPRMWNRRAGDSDFCLVRVGLGIRPLATRLVAPEVPPVERSDPVTVAALQRFLDAHSIDRGRADHHRVTWNFDRDDRRRSGSGAGAATRDGLPVGGAGTHPTSC